MEEQPHERFTNELNRRQFVQNAGVAGFGIIGLSGSALGQKKTPTQFVSTALENDISFERDEVRRLSEVAIDVPPQVSIDEDDNQIHLTKFARQETKDQIMSQNVTMRSAIGGSSSENDDTVPSYMATKIDEYSPILGFEVPGGYPTPTFEVGGDQASSVLVNGKQYSLPEQSEREVELPKRTATINVYDPDVTDSSERRWKQVEKDVVPHFHMRNHGNLSITSSDSDIPGGDF